MVNRFNPLKIGALLLLVATAASANPFYLGRFSGLRSGPLDQGPFATYWNPGNLATPGFGAQLNVLGVLRHATYDRDAKANQVPDELKAVNSGQNEVNGRGIVPSLALTYGRQTQDWTIGFGLSGFVDRSGVGNWEKTLGAPAEFPGGLDGPQRFATISTRLLILSTGAGVGFEYRPARLRVGATVVGNFASLSTSRARNPDTSERVVDEAGRLAEGRILVRDSTDETVSFIVGLQWNPIDWLDVGLTWHSAVNYRLTGPTAIVFGLASPTTVESALELPVPDTYRLEARFQVSARFAVRPMFAYSPWSVLERQTAVNTANNELLFAQERNFNDLFIGRLAVDYAIDTNLLLHGGVTFENGVTPHKNFEPGLSESNNWEYAVGATFDLGPVIPQTKRTRWRIGLTASWQQFDDVEVTESPQTPSTNGRYTDRRNYFGLDVEYRL